MRVCGTPMVGAPDRIPPFKHVCPIDMPDTGKFVFWHHGNAQISRGPQGLSFHPVSLGFHEPDFRLLSSHPIR